MLTNSGNVHIMEHRGCSNNHCCHQKAISITYSECVPVALVIQHAKHMRHPVFCGLSCSTIFLHYLINITIFGKKLLNVKMGIFIFSVYLKHVST